MGKKITGNFIIQIAGKPVENVTRAIDFIEKKLNEDENFKIINIEKEKTELDEESSLYLSFMEVSARFNSLSELNGFIFDYSPTSIEIEEPEKIEISSNELTEILNIVSDYIIQTQTQVRKANATIIALDKKLKEKNT